MDSPSAFQRLRIEKNKAMKAHQRDYDGKVATIPEIQEDLRWWVDNASAYPSPIARHKPHFVLKSDTSGQSLGEWEMITRRGACGQQKNRNNI